MNKFLKNILIFSLLILAILFVLDKVLPYYWGSQGYRNKIPLLQNQKDVNTIFIGSSRTYRQIDPVIFDSLNNNQTKSFNLGVPATYSIESYYIIENLINQNTVSGLKNVFIELQPIIKFANANKHKAKSNYYITYNRFNKIKKYFQESSIKEEEKKENIKNYRTALIENYLKVNFLNNFLDFKLSKRLNPKMYQGHLANGFYGLEQQRDDSKTYNDYKKRNELFLADTTTLSGRIDIASTAYAKNNSKTKSADIHLGIIQELIVKAKAKGINLKFILPPRLPDSYEELIYISEKLGKENVIDLGDPSKFPLLYSAQMSFDIGHLNYVGVKYYTNIIYQSK